MPLNQSQNKHIHTQTHTHEKTNACIHNKCIMFIKNKKQKNLKAKTK